MSSSCDALSILDSSGEGAERHLRTITRRRKRGRTPNKCFFKVRKINDQQQYKRATAKQISFLHTLVLTKFDMWLWHCLSFDPISITTIFYYCHKFILFKESKLNIQTSCLVSSLTSFEYFDRQISCTNRRDDTCPTCVCSRLHTPSTPIKTGCQSNPKLTELVKKSLIFIERNKTSWKIWVAQVLTISKSSISFWEVFGSNFDLYVTEVINTCCTLMEVSMRCATSSMRRWACA